MIEPRPLSHSPWQRFTHQPYLLLTITAVLWASNLILGRLIAGHVPPIAFTIFRWGGAALLMLPFAWPHLKPDWPAIRGDFPLILALGVMGYAANSIIAYYGLQYTTALNALLMQSAAPLVVALWSLLLFRMTLTVAQMIGIATSLLGVLIIILHGNLGTLAGIAFNRGDILIATSILIFGLYSALVSRRRKMHPLSLLVVGAGLATILMLPFAVLEAAQGYRLKADLFTLVTALYGALFASAIAILSFNRGVELVGPNRAAPFFHLVPVFGSVMAIAFLGEQPMLYHLTGYVLVLAGVFVAARM